MGDDVYLGDIDLDDLFGQSSVYSCAGLGNDFSRTGIDHIFAQSAPDELWVIRCHVADDFAVRRLDKAILIDPCEGSQAADQADVWTFGCFDRANAAVVRVMHIAHIKACSFSPQTTRAKSRKGALVAQLGERVGLVHKLG